MRLRNIQEVEDFKVAIGKCVGDVWLESVQGDRFNLKSFLSCYVALGQLISEQGENLELFCEFKDDQRFFYKFFDQHPNVLV